MNMIETRPIILARYLPYLLKWNQVEVVYPFADNGIVVLCFTAFMKVDDSSKIHLFFGAK